MLHLEVSRFIPPSSWINYKRRPAPSHSNATLKSNLRYSCLGVLPQLFFCILIASTARIGAGLRNLCMLKPARDSGQSSFWGVSSCDCSLAPRTTTSSTSWSPNVYVLSFLVAERLCPLLPCGRTSTSLYIPVVVPVFPK